MVPLSSAHAIVVCMWGFFRFDLSQRTPFRGQQSDFEIGKKGCGKHLSSIPCSYWRLPRRNMLVTWWATSGRYMNIPLRRKVE